MAESTEMLNIKEEESLVIDSILDVKEEEKIEEIKPNAKDDDKVHPINVFSEDHSTPISPVKAVLLSSTNENETILSDDENRVMFTLEPPAKPSVEFDDNEIEIDEVEIDEIEEEEDDDDNEETHEDINEYLHESEQAYDNKSEFKVTVFDSPSDAEISEIAKKQLESLNKTKIKVTKKLIPVVPKLSKTQTVSITVVNKAGNSTGSLPCYVLGRDKNNPEQDIQSNGREPTKVRPGVKIPPFTLGSTILSKDDINKEITKKFKVKSPVKIIEDRILTKQDLEPLKHDSDIEIPAELILSSEVTPIILNEQCSSSIKNQDLIDILEGNDDELDISPKVTPKKVIDKELEKEIALRQIMNLPGKTRGRKAKPKPIPVPKKVKPVVKAVTQSIVDALVSDWSDNETKTDETTEVVVKEEKSPVANKLKRKIIAAPKSTIKTEKVTEVEVEVVPIKRSRVIKKKIIWDPDAPESKVSFASLVKKEQTKDEKKNIPDLIQIAEVKPTTTKRETPGGRSTPNTIKKRKLTEIDKLLGDEGAVNMIYSLERENNNSDVPEIETKPNKDSFIDKTKEKKDLVTRTKAIRNAVIKQSNTSEDRPRAKRETPVKVIPNKVTNPKKKSISRESLNSENWDYVYSQRQDDSMIIRRRSNSSYSSSSPRRLSVDVQQMSQEDLNLYGAGNEVAAATTSTKKGKGKSFEFVKPNNKKQTKADSSSEVTVVSDLKGKITKAIGKMISPPTNRRGNRSDSAEIVDLSPFKKFEKIAETNEFDGTTFKTISVKIMDGIVQIIFTSTTTKLENVFTAEVNLFFVFFLYFFLIDFFLQCMKEISEILDQLDEDESNKVVILSSSSNDFCKGLDFTSLLQLTKDKKISAATELAFTVR